MEWGVGSGKARAVAKDREMAQGLECDLDAVWDAVWEQGKGLEWDAVWGAASAVRMGAEWAMTKDEVWATNWGAGLGRVRALGSVETWDGESDVT